MNAVYSIIAHDLTDTIANKILNIFGSRVKVQFPITVKYNRKVYPPYTDIIADESDLPEMKKSGAVVFEEQVEQEEKPVATPKRKKSKSGRLTE